MKVDIYNADCLEQLEKIEENSIDSIVTDPPYELNFMGKGWDNAGVSFNKNTWEKCLKVLKPGGYLLAFGGSRTYHRIACAIEDAGFEIRDTIMWLYGSGFPKSMDISKQIDKRGGESTSWFGEYLKNALKEKNMTYSDLAKHFLSKTGGITGCVHNWVEGKNMPTIEQFNKICKILDLPFKKMEEAEREIIGTQLTNKTIYQKIGDKNESGEINITIPETDLAKQWQGWGTALKPSFEPIIIARKPFKGSLVDNVMQYGVGGINIDECRVGNEERTYKGAGGSDITVAKGAIGTGAGKDLEFTVNGRFPANTILTYDETDFDEVCGGFPNTKSQKRSAKYNKDTEYTNTYTPVKSDYRDNNTYGDSGSAARYFMNCKYTGKDEEFRRYIYTPKASKRDRDEGLEDFEESKVNDGRKKDIDNAFQRGVTLRHNTHPTVKPTSLMQYLVRLVTPKGGIIVDPFMGSGSTGKAVMFENNERQANYSFIGIEKEKEYCDIAKARIAWASEYKENKEDDNQIHFEDLGGLI